MESGELIVIDPEFVRRSITSLNLITMSMYHGRSPEQANQFADDVATYALRGLLSTLTGLPAVRRAGVEVARGLNNRLGAPA